MLSFGEIESFKCLAGQFRSKNRHKGRGEFISNSNFYGADNNIRDQRIVIRECFALIGPRINELSKSSLESAEPADSVRYAHLSVYLHIISSAF